MPNYPPPHLHRTRDASQREKWLSPPLFAQCCCWCCTVCEHPPATIVSICCIASRRRNVRPDALCGRGVTLRCPRPEFDWFCFQGRRTRRRLDVAAVWPTASRPSRPGRIPHQPCLLPSPEPGIPPLWVFFCETSAVVLQFWDAPTERIFSN